MADSTQDLNPEQNQDDLTLNNIIDEGHADESEKTQTEVKSEEENIKSNATLRQPYSTKVESSGQTFNGYKFSMPSVPLKAFTKLLNSYESLDLDDKDPVVKSWKETVENSIDNYTPTGLYQSRFYDNESEFEQGLLTPEGELLSISEVKTKDKVGDIKGEVALLKIAKFLGVGELVRIPLYHSGLWLTVKPPSEADILDFFYTVYNDKIILGRKTSGYTLSNHSVHFNNSLIDFIIAHVHSTNVNGLSTDDLKKHISIHDLNALAWGFAASFYPNGYEYTRACLNKEFCSHRITEKLNLHKLLWVDQKALSEYQKQYMIDYRANRKSMEEFNKYKAEHLRVRDSYIKITTSTDKVIKFNLRNPSLEDYVTNGLTWVNHIVSIVEDQVMNIEDREEKDEKRIEYINQQIKVSILQQYNHFVESIEIDDNLISDRDTINGALNMFSTDDKIRDSFFEQLNKFIEKNTISVVGIPSFTCPACGKVNEDEKMPVNFKDVIPVDVINIFFGLLTLRFSVIMAR